MTEKKTRAKHFTGASHVVLATLAALAVGATHAHSAMYAACEKAECSKEQTKNALYNLRRGGYITKDDDKCFAITAKGRVVLDSGTVIRTGQSPIRVKARAKAAQAAKKATAESTKFHAALDYQGYVSLTNHEGDSLVLENNDAVATRDFLNAVLPV